MDQELFVELPENLPQDRIDNIRSKLKEWSIYDSEQQNNKLYLKRLECPDFFQIISILDNKTSKKKIKQTAKQCYNWADKLADLPEKAHKEYIKQFFNKLKNVEDPLKSQAGLEQFVMSIKNLAALPYGRKFPSVLSETLKFFFKSFPKGKVMVINKHPSYHIRSRIPPILSAYDYLSSDDIFELIPGEGKRSGLPNFGQGHFLMNRDYFAGIINFSSPDLLGFTAQWLSYEMIFLFGVRMRDNFPQATKHIKGVGNEMWGGRVRRRKLCSFATPQDYVDFLSWYTERLNKFLKFSFDLTNFVGPDGKVSVVEQNQQLLTIDSLFEILLRVFYSDDELTKKLLFFQFADRFSALTGHKQLVDTFSTKFFNNKMLDSLRTLRNHYVKHKLRKHFRFVRTIIFQETLEGILQKSRKRNGFVMLDQNMTEKLSNEKYCLRFLDVLRDTVHSYTLDKDRYKKFLSINSGSVSDYLSDLMLPMLFYLIADPHVSLRRFNKYR